MEWDVQFDEDFAVWLAGLQADLRNEIIAHANLLRQHGPQLGRPYVDTLDDSTFTNMKELRVQFRGDPGESCLRSIPTGQPFCWLAETSGAINAGTRNTFPSPMDASVGI